MILIFIAAAIALMAAMIAAALWIAYIDARYLS
jgi:hypothetical protein